MKVVLTSACLAKKIVYFYSIFIKNDANYCSLAMARVVICIILNEYWKKNTQFFLAKQALVNTTFIDIFTFLTFLLIQQ